MNVLSGTVNEILVHGNLSLVRIGVMGITLTSIVIETPLTASYLQIGASLRVMFKETEVIIGKENGPAVSLQNRIPVTIKEINQGKLLSQLTLTFHSETIRSIITTNAVNQMQLRSGDRVLAMIKTNELMLLE